jgi:YARHG domain
MEKTMKTLLGMLFATVALVPSAQAITSPECSDLWVERNGYYARAGYCFKTPDAIEYFGSDGCVIHSENAVPLRPTIRARISEIKRIERSLRCE